MKWVPDALLLSEVFVECEKERLDVLGNNSVTLNCAQQPHSLGHRAAAYCEFVSINTASRPINTGDVINEL